jgi:chromosome segregation ATPase
MKTGRGSGAPGPDAPEPIDPLPGFLDLASREGALEGEGLAAFLEALRARASLVLAERVERLERRLPALEAEIAWRRESMAALEESVQALGQQAQSLSEELRRASEAHAALVAHAEALADERRKASEAHAVLLSHHRELIERVAAELESIAALSPLRSGQARRRLRALAGLLRSDSR